ncbi:MAG: helix-turn-helix domain-containing protein, partial [Deltaproteobacteria bacterium]|nr:helix-turn-helix domain-containing protein [Deltaproteobacteria bacterium]
MKTFLLLWSLDEAARQLSVSSRTVRRLVAQGEIPTVRIRRSLRIPAQAVEAWVESHTNSPHNQRCAGKAVPTTEER